MNNLIPLLVLFFTPNILFGQSTLYVPDDFSSIQAGINGMQNGDTLIVRDGTYIENINFNGKAITVQSENGNLTTIIDGNQSGSVGLFNSGEGGNSILQGFTLTNGSGVGGGLRFSNGASPTIRECYISLNGDINSTVYDGAGGYIGDGTSPTIENCTFYLNMGRYGAGLYISGPGSSPTIENCTFNSNITNYDGGGIYSRPNATPIIKNCVFEYNKAGSFMNGGGGIWLGANSGISSINDCTFVQNSAGQGGGIWSGSNVNLALNSCTFIENVAFDEGGGIYFQYSGSAILNSCVFITNFADYGGGIYCGDIMSLYLDKCTLTDNLGMDQGGGICQPSTQSILNITNSIIWENRTGGNGQDPDFNGQAIINYNNLTPGYYWPPGSSNIFTDPLFVNFANNDVHLQSNSPCIDTGDPNSTLDPDGTRADMGAYYFDQSNAPPIAIDDFVSVQYDMTIVIDALANDSDPNNDLINLISIGSPSNGTAIITGDQISYSPNQGWVGTDSFIYFIEDTGGNAASATVTVEVTRPVYIITNFIAGVYADFRISDITPNSEVVIGYSLTGPGPTNTAFGPVDLTPPIKKLVALTADINGNVVFSPLVPAGTLGVTFYTQAKCGNMLSNSLALTVQ